ncbi:MAG: hypothetical protein ACPGQP_03585 [Nitrosopumilus sp.]
MGNPEVLESLNKVKETTSKVNEIIQGLQTPEMVKNIENFRLISENMNEASIKIQNTMYHLRETGLIDETTDAIKSAKEQINSFSNDGNNGVTGKDIRDVTVTAKEMLVSVKDLINELTVTVISSKKSEIICNAEDTINEMSDIYKTVSQVD